MLERRYWTGWDGYLPRLCNASSICMPPLSRLAGRETHSDAAYWRTQTPGLTGIPYLKAATPDLLHSTTQASLHPPPLQGGFCHKSNKSLSSTSTSSANKRWQWELPFVWKPNWSRKLQNPSSSSFLDGTLSSKVRAPLDFLTFATWIGGRSWKKRNAEFEKGNNSGWLVR